MEHDSNTYFYIVRILSIIDKIEERQLLVIIGI